MKKTMELMQISITPSLPWQEDAASPASIARRQYLYDELLYGAEELEQFNERLTKIIHEMPFGALNTTKDYVLHAIIDRYIRKYTDGGRTGYIPPMHKSWLIRAAKDLIIRSEPFKSGVDKRLDYYAGQRR